MAGTLRLSGDTVPQHIATGILALIERLQPGDGLCHGDLHPGNVIMTGEGPRIVDWGWAVRGPAALDLGFSHVIHTAIAPRRAEDPQRPRAINAATQSEYVRLTSMSQTALMAEMEHRSGPGAGGVNRVVLQRRRWKPFTGIAFARTAVFDEAAGCGPTVQFIATRPRRLVLPIPRQRA
jgi:aminoglycoside phosphotransferase (APT) family kinase protein